MTRAAPITRLQRLGIFLLGVVGLFIATQAIYPTEAFLWHCFHGNTAQVGGAEFTLPAMWWRSADEKNGIVVFKHAIYRFSPTGELSLSQIRLNQLAPAERKTDVEWVQLLAHPPARTESIHWFTKPTELGDLRCSSLAGHEDDDISCDGPDSFPWAIRYNPSSLPEGKDKDRDEAEGILTSAILGGK